jgi:L-lactate dehydrogenase (cytochrome)
MGKKGVTKALQIFHKELDITMALCGENNNENIGRHNLIRISL